MTSERHLLNQSHLERLLRERLATAGLTDGTLLDLQKQLSALGQDADRTQVAVVIRHFEAAAFVRGCLRFVSLLSPEQRETWHQSLTRTVFLLGSPRALRERFDFAFVTQDSSMGWLAPRPARELAPLSRLLKPLVTSTPYFWPSTMVPGTRSGPPRRVHLATKGLRLEQILIHLHHLLVEASLEGYLDAEEPLVVQAAPELASLPPGARVRVGQAHGGESALCAYALLEPAQNELQAPIFSETAVPS